jgi:dihydroxy-acid dehydratase
VSDEELALRKPPFRETGAFATAERGWQKLYIEHVQGADTGADLDFLVGSSGSQVTRESH